LCYISYELLDCPEFVHDEDRCEEITASIGIFVEDGVTNANQLAREFESAMEVAIRSQQLQISLDRIHMDAPLWIVTGTDVAPPRATSLPPPYVQDEYTPDGLSLGAVVGMITGGLVALLIFMGIFLRRRGPTKRRDSTGKDTDIEDGVCQVESEESTSTAVQSQNTNKSGPQSPFDYDYDQRDRPPPPPEAVGADKTTSDDASSSSSYAGSSGWSSYASPSTRDTSCSIDESTPSEGFEHLVDLGEMDSWNGVALRRRSFSGDPSTEEEVATTVSYLDQANESGDWAAVGGTGAMLASSSFEASCLSVASSTSNHTFLRAPLRSNAIIPARAAELAASRYGVEGVDESSIGDWLLRQKNTLDSNDGDQSLDTGTGKISIRSLLESVASSLATRGGDQQADDDNRSLCASTSPIQSQGSTCEGSSLDRHAAITTTSEVFSDQARLGEIQAEIEILTRDVAPEEMDNIDDMMAHFKGNEEELLETLWTMKERSVAQRARLADRKTAQRAARATVAAKENCCPTIYIPTGDVATDVRSCYDLSCGTDSKSQTAEQGNTTCTSTSSTEHKAVTGDVKEGTYDTILDTVDTTEASL
jgi:hypothetical protein